MNTRKQLSIISFNIYYSANVKKNNKNDEIKIISIEEKKRIMQENIKINAERRRLNKIKWDNIYKESLLNVTIPNRRKNIDYINNYCSHAIRIEKIYNDLVNNIIDGTEAFDMFKVELYTNEENQKNFSNDNHKKNNKKNKKKYNKCIDCNSDDSDDDSDNSQSTISDSGSDDNFIDEYINEYVIDNNHIEENKKENVKIEIENVKIENVKKENVKIENVKIENVKKEEIKIENNDIDIDPKIIRKNINILLKNIGNEELTKKTTKKIKNINQNHTEIFLIDSLVKIEFLLKNYKDYDYFMNRLKMIKKKK